MTTDRGTAGLLGTIQTTTVVTCAVPANGVAAVGIVGMAVTIAASSTTTAVLTTISRWPGTRRNLSQR
jgi:hypothetical protein